MNISNASPKAMLLGVDDKSIRTPIPEGVNLPIHLPFTYTFAQRGTTVPLICVGNEMVTSFGACTFDYREKWCTHQTVLINKLNANANYQMLNRLIPEDAKKATLVLWVEILGADVPTYERMADGTYSRDLGGKIIPTNATIAGNKLRYYFAPSSTPGLVGKEKPHAGAMTAPGSTKPSQCYPILEMAISSEGSYGNNIGLRLSAPTAGSDIPTDEDIIAEQEAFIYRMQFFERADEMSTGVTAKTLASEQFIEFTFKRDVVNTKLDQDLFIDGRILPAYNESVKGFVPKMGPINQLHTYEDNLAVVLTQLSTAEDAARGIVTDIHEFNFIGLTSHAGVPYETAVAETLADDSVMLTEYTTVYATGGDDGDISAENFDKMVAAHLTNWGEGEYPLRDSAKYPCSCVIDSGFHMDTKKKLFYPMSIRKDMYVVLATQDIAEPANSISGESSIQIGLRTFGRMFPESAYYGTPICRAVIIGQCGKLVGSTYPHLVPGTIDFVVKCSKYMGAANGKFKKGMGFDVWPRNIISEIKDINCTWKPEGVRNKDWSNGLTWIQNYDVNDTFFPGIQTIYDNDTSVLNSAITMIGVVELEKIAERVWRKLTGDSSLTRPQFIEKSDKLIVAATKDTFDSRFVIKSETVFTDSDNARGYSWHTIIRIYANNMKTVNLITIEADRMESLNV